MIKFYGYSRWTTARKAKAWLEENNLEFEYSIEEMVIMARAPYKRLFQDYSKEDYQIVKDNLKRVGMEEYGERNYSSLSGGEKQRVLMARSFTQQTDILLLDEPTNHLDIYYQLYLMQLITSMQKTVVAVFHELNLAAKFCDYIYVLKDGRVVAEGEPKTLYTQALFKEVYNIDVSVIQQELGVPYVIFNQALEL